MKNTDAWLMPKNHNQRRVSRMIKSNPLLHSDEAADTCFSLVFELSRERHFASEGKLRFWETD